MAGIDLFQIGSRIEVAVIDCWAVGSITDMDYSDDGSMLFCEVAYDSQSTEFDSIIYEKQQFRPIPPIEADRVFSKGEIVEFLIDGLWFNGEVLKFRESRNEYSVKRVQHRAYNVDRKRKRMQSYTVGVNFIRPPKSWNRITGSWNAA